MSRSRGARVGGLWFLVVLGLLAGACEQPEPDPAEDGATDEVGELGQLYRDYLALVAEVDGFFCACAVASGEYANPLECVAARGGPSVPPVLGDCYAAVYDAHPEARAELECQLGAVMLLRDCLENIGCGGDFGACSAADVEPCPAPSYAIEVELAATCLGYELPAAFTCADGATIAPWLACDGWSDCVDGSDEPAGCSPG